MVVVIVFIIFVFLIGGWEWVVILLLGWVLAFALGCYLDNRKLRKLEREEELERKNKDKDL